MDQIELEVTLRKATGKGASHRDRSSGRIPGVLYGRGMETFLLTLNPDQLKKILTTGARENTLISLKVSGPGSEKVGKRVVMLKDLQMHPVKGTYLHADFYAIAMHEKIEVDVPIHLIGKSEGVKAGGILEQPRREVRVRCLPTEIPEFLEVDVSALNIGDSLHIQELSPKFTCEIVADSNFTVASVTPPISEAKYEEIVTAPAEGEKEIAQPERIGEKKEEAAAPETKEKEKKEAKEKEKKE